MGDSRRSTAVAVIIALAVAGAAFSAPTISSITPASALTRGGEIVHIHGTNLLGPALACPSIVCSTYVKFGDNFATIIGGSATEIVAVAPPHAAGHVDLEVNVPTNPIVKLASAYTYFDAPADQVRVLVPIVINTAGASGTNWRTDLVAYNGNAEAVTIGDTTIVPLSASALNLQAQGGSAGAFISLPKRFADSVGIQARVHDTTRDSDSWGVEIPAVPESQFRRSVVLLAVPGDARYRTLLRVYGYDTAQTGITVTLRDDATGELLSASTFVMQSGYAQIPIAATRPRVHVQVSAERSLLWAFVSITNNTTQQVTTITPTFTATVIAPPATLELGHWGNGGQQCVEVQSNGVRVEAGCWHGAFPLPTIGADGSFEADGTLYFGGPVPPNVPAAHFVGIVQGTTMTVVAVTGSGTLGPYTVTFADPARCVLCL